MRIFCFHLGTCRPEVLQASGSKGSNQVYTKPNTKSKDGSPHLIEISAFMSSNREWRIAGRTCARCSLTESGRAI
jgi:hypothetical protein